MLSNLTVKVGADIEGLRKELNKANSQLQGFGASMKNVGGMIAGAFTVGAIVSVGKEIFRATAQFEKFNAVLTNTLGDSAAARVVMNDISDFAARTPYQVDELTGSFVKLANQGFIPTINEMTKLGDLAAAQGKSFDQLTEAIIDAQTGEFERLKEFGVRAKKQGDQVTFTFKGVEKQVQFTSSAIREYILSLGDAKGVAGGMEAQSKTLGGGLSNLSDAFDQLSVAIGTSANSGGFLSDVLDALSVGVKKLTGLFTAPTIQQNVDAMKELIKLRQAAARSGDIEAWAKYNDLIQQGTEKVREYYFAQKKLEELRKSKATTAQKQGASSPIPVESGSKSNGDLSIGVKDIDLLSRSLPLLDVMPTALANVSERMKVPAQTIVSNIESIPNAILGAIPIIESGLEDAAISFGAGIGNILAGAGGISDLGPILLSSLGGVLVQLGQMAIQTGIAIESIKVALKSMKGPVAIAAGVALIALGTAVRAKASKIGSSMGKGSGGGGLGGGGGSSFNSSRSISSSDAQDVQVGGTVVLRGEDMWLVLKNYERNNNQTRPFSFV